MKKVMMSTLALTLMFFAEVFPQIVASNSFVTITPENVYFDCDVNSRSVRFKNVVSPRQGAIPAEAVRVTSLSPWLFFNNDTLRVKELGTLLPGDSSQAITLRVDRKGLSKGVYSGIIGITWLERVGGSFIVANYDTITMAVGPFFTSSKVLSFNGKEMSLEIEINNCTQGVLTWTARADQSPIKISRDTGSTATKTSTTIPVEVNLIEIILGPGINHIGKIFVNSNKGFDTVSVMITIGPELAVSPNSLNFFSSANVLTFEIKNTGEETLAWTATDDQPWIQVNPNSGNTTTETDQVTVSASRSGLSPGSYAGKIFVNSNGGIDTVKVNMEVLPDQRLSVTPATLDFERTKNIMSFGIKNDGTGTLRWNVNDNKSWITLSPDSGSSILETDTVKVTIDRRDLALFAGQNLGKVTVSSNGGTKELDIIVRVNYPPKLGAVILDTTLTLGNTNADYIRKLNTPPFVFSDQDNEPLLYSAFSSDTSVAKASVLIGNLKISLTTNPPLRGFATIRLTGDDNFGGRVANEFKVFANRVPVVKHILADSIWRENEDLQVNSEITDDLGISSVVLSLRRGGDKSLFSIPIPRLSDTKYSYSIPAFFLTTRGLEYNIRAKDIKGIETQTKNYCIQVAVTDSGLIKRISDLKGGGSNPYRLFSIPLDLEKKNPRAVLEDDLGIYDKKKWRFYELEADQKPHELPDVADMRMTPGKAFWLTVKDPGKAIDTGLGKSNLTNKPYSISLHAGWNFVGNPFNFSVPVENVRLKSDTSKLLNLRSFPGFWDTTKVKVLQPFEGYAISIDNSSDVLLINPDLSPHTNSSGKAQYISNTNQILFSIRILAHCQEASDVDNIVGVMLSASQYHDELDQPEPPVIGEYVSVYFPHPEWSKLAKNYCTDIRPMTSDGEIWPFEVKTNIRDKVNLTFEGVDEVPKELEVWLVDDALKITQNLRENHHYTVAGSEQPKLLKLVVGKRDFVGEKLAEAQAIPATYELSQNFPNPFNPATTIRYGLPQAGRVTLKIYNLLGAEVARIINDAVRAAGYHAAIWDGRDKNGVVMASGVYVYRLQAGSSIVMTKKLALVK